MVLVSAARSRSWCGAGRSSPSVGLATSRATSVERGLGEGRGGELFDRGEHDGVFELCEVAFEHGADERGAHLGTAQDLACPRVRARRRGRARAG